MVLIMISPEPCTAQHGTPQHAALDHWLHTTGHSALVILLVRNNAAAVSPLSFHQHKSWCYSRALHHSTCCQARGSTPP